MLSLSLALSPPPLSLPPSASLEEKIYVTVLING